MWAPVVPDGEVEAFLSGFRAADNWFHLDWWPRYRATIALVESELSHRRPENLFAILWKTRDNSIANAGQGMMSAAAADNLRTKLVQIIADVQSDPAPDNYDRIVKRVERWRSEGRIKNVPRLMIRRVFSGLHPELYHTTVDEDCHNAALKWFAKHTKFSVPKSKSWAVRARALVAHLDQLEWFEDDLLVRNMFPWCVVTQLNTRNSPGTIKHRHRMPPSDAFMSLPPAQRKIAMRHRDVQNALYLDLAKQYGLDQVWTEHATGTGGFADVVVRPLDGGCYLYEIKIAPTAAEVTRQAMGQLLEYGFRANGLEPTKLIVVGEPALDAITQRFVERLRAQFNLNIEYLQVELSGKVVS